jgi:hypothetical protein
MELTRFYTLQYSNGVLLPAESALISVGKDYNKGQDVGFIDFGGWGYSKTDFDPATARIGVPEPAMLGTLLFGFLGAGLFWRKRSIA